MDQDLLQYPRLLKVAEVGDFWRKRTMPQLRLRGKWMLRAGIQPNTYERITNPQPGILVIQILDSEK